MRIAVVVGTRPEAIKLAPVVALLGPEAIVIHTGQHYSAGMAGHLTPDVVLDTHDDHEFTLRPPTRASRDRPRPASTRPLIHLEAGLRSFDRAMPEEHHRVLIDHLADLCCAPTPLARDNLLAERIHPERIEITGNTIVEAVAAALPDEQEQTHILDHIGLTTHHYAWRPSTDPKTPTTPITWPPSCAN